MASLRPSSPPSSRPMRAPAGSSADALPADVLFEVLVRLPARELCRLRAVCRSWRSLTCNPLFIREHTARHPGPLLPVSFRDDQAHIHVVDLSGNVVKRIAADGHRLVSTRLDLACAETERNSCRVLNPATGAALVLPGIPIVGNRTNETDSWPYTSFAFGRIAATGHYKVLRVYSRRDSCGFAQQQLFDVLTVNGPPDDAEWREMASNEDFVETSSAFVETCSAVVVDGVVYFLMDRVYGSMLHDGVDPGIRPDCIFSLDLDQEAWRRDLQGPVSVNLAFNNPDDFDEYRSIWSQLTLAELKGSLALSNYCGYRSTIDLWILADFENGLWVKECTIQTESILQRDGWWIKTLFALDDGRLIMHLGWSGLLLIYDPGMNSFAEVETRPIDVVGMYTGNLLSLQVGNMV